MENDVEYQDSQAAASRVVSVEAVFPGHRGEIAEARSWIKTCETCLLVRKPWAYNEANLRAARVCKNTGKLISAEALHHLKELEWRLTAGDGV